MLETVAIEAEASIAGEVQNKATTVVATTKVYQTVVQELKDKIDEEGWGPIFEKAIQSSRGFRLPELQDITSLESYLDDINEWLSWVPREDASGNVIYHRIAIFYFILNQPSLKHLHPSATPESLKEPLTWLSDWLLRYAKTLGRFLDSPQSIDNHAVQSFKDSPSFHLDDYVEPPGSWKTFNEFFARNLKPGRRPIDGIDDPTVIVFPADARFEGQWAIGGESRLTAKHVEWRVSEMLGGSAYKDRFAGGVFMHATLGANDYHHIHAPVSGTVLEAVVMPGQAAFDVVAKASESGEVAGFDFRGSIDTPGYQMAQARGLILLDTEIGLVAILPIGMAQVDSVVITTQIGQFLIKGDEMSYFQFGGSDVVLMFEKKSNVVINAERGIRYNMGLEIGKVDVRG